MEYFNRFIEKDFTHWKNNLSNLALEITGGRQIGKTTTVLHFARGNYQNIIYVNVASDNQLALLESVDENTVLEKLVDYCNVTGKMFTNDKRTVIIFDEIQESQRLYERIRIFNRCLDCDLIITGSNLTKTKNFFQPAGDLHEVRMYPLSYEEYLDYFKGYSYYKENAIDVICKEKYDWFKQVYETYLLVGGYPAVFKAYLEGRSIRSAFESLLNAFKSEFRVTTGNPADYDKIEQMFSTICLAMSREKKGDARILDSISKRISTEECNNILAWLSAARIINYCDKVDLSTKEMYYSERFYFEDVGILNYLCDKYQIAQTATKGMLAETFVFKQLRENHFIDRFYQERPAFAVSGAHELDFYVTSRVDDKSYGIEVKAGDNSGISVKRMLEQKQLDYAVYAKGESKVGTTEHTYTMPIFLLNKFEFDKGGKIIREPLRKIDVFTL